MSAIQSKQELVSSDKGETHESWTARIMRRSAGTAALVELGITLAGAESSTAMPRWCLRCQGRQDPRSTAHYPKIFCSANCEREFIRAALASLTLQDCIRIHRRLENLLMDTR